MKLPKKVFKIFNTRVFFNDAIICCFYVASIINKVKKWLWGSGGMLMNGKY